jgi:hydrogenase nickel incorporation protein HypA/HybF
MHELSVIEGILKISLEVAEENAISRINRINLTVGKLQHLNEMILQHGFTAAKQNTIAKDSNLILDWKPVRLMCEECQHNFSPVDNDFTCPQCRSGRTRIEQGRELFIKSIEGD